MTTVANYSRIDCEPHVCLYTILYTPYSDYLRHESIHFLASTRRVTALCVCVCCIICMWGSHITTTQSPTHTMQLRARIRQWPGTLKPKSYSLGEDNRTLLKRVYLFRYKIIRPMHTEARTPSKFLPPWLDTNIPETPCSTASRADSAVTEKGGLHLRF